MSLPYRDASLEDAIARQAGTSVWTVLRHRAGKKTLSAAAIEAALTATGYRDGHDGKTLASRHTLRLHRPFVDTALAHLLGYFVGDGNKTKSGICLTCGRR